MSTWQIILSIVGGAAFSALGVALLMSWAYYQGYKAGKGANPFYFESDNSFHDYTGL